MERSVSKCCLVNTDSMNISFSEWNGSSDHDSSDNSSSDNDIPSSTGTAVVRREQHMIYNSTTILCSSLEYIIAMPDLCDVMFVIGKEGTPIYGVKAILATRSRVLYQLLLHYQRKKDTEKLKRKPVFKGKEGKIVIPISDYDVDVFSRLIKFIHCGKVTVQPEHAIGLLCAASQFELTDLFAACWDFILRCKRHSSKKIIQTLLTSSVKYNSKKSAGQAMNEIQRCDV